MAARRSDRVELIPDVRFRERNVSVSGIGNIRFRLELKTPRFSINLGGKDVAQRVANMVRDRISQNYAAGRDANGIPLPPLNAATIERRARRRRQREDDSGAKTERFRLRGRGQTGRTSYESVDAQTPFRESGLAAENVVVNFKGTESGDPVFLLAWPTGGKNRGLVNDDGRGARLFAVQHYGFERMAGIPPELDEAIDRELAQHLEAVLHHGGSIAQLLARTAARVERFVTEGAEGDPED